MGFDSIRDEEAKTKKINLNELNDSDFELEAWRKKKFIDAGRWDYIGPKNKGLAGEMGWLNITIELNRADLGDGSEAVAENTIKQDFLNHIETVNSEVRSQYPGYSEDNLTHVLAPVPETFEWIEVNDTRMLTWLSDETKGTPKTYYILPINPKYFVSISVSSHTSVNNERDLEQVSRIINVDSSKIIESFIFSY